MLQQLVICQAEQQYEGVYAFIESESIYVSPVTKLMQTSQTKWEPNLVLSLNHSLKIQLWAYQPHIMLQQWSFDQRKIANMKQKQIISQNKWILFLKTTENNLCGKENMQNRSNKSQSNQKQIVKIRPKVEENKLKKSKKKRDQIKNVLQNRSKNNKSSIKKALKSTIQYLIKHQSQVGNFQHYGFDQNAKKSVKSSTGKCTPTLQQFSSIKNQSTVFSEYGLNITELNENKSTKNTKKVKSQLNSLSKQSQNQIIR